MRLFFAFDIPPDQRARLASLVPADVVGARHTDPELMHVTLRFVGAVSEETRVALAHGLARLPFEPGTAEIRGAGTFPSTGRPKVLWAGVSVDEPLTATQSAIEELCAANGIEAEDRPWTPHVTLARVRRGQRPRWIRGFLEEQADFGLPPFPVDRIVLLDSVQDANGHRYETVAVRSAT